MERSAFSKGRRCACGNVRLASRAITQFYDRCLRPSGLRSTQFSLLLNIFLHDNISVGELADLLVMDQTTVSRNLEGLKEKQYIVIRQEKGDARKKLLSVTPAGITTLRETMPLWENAQEHIENGLGRDRFQELLKMLADLNLLTK